MSIRLRANTQLSGYLFFAFIAWTSLSFQSAQADGNDPFQLAPLSSNEKCLPKWIAPPQSLPPKNADNTAVADEVSQKNAHDYRLTGNVVLEQPGMVILSNQIDINRLQQTAHAFGQVQLHQKDMILTGSSAFFNQQTHTADIENSAYQFTQSRAHGTANKVTVDQLDKTANLQDANFTTCKLTGFAWKNRANKVESAQKYDWELDFSHLKIDDAKRRIYGKNAVLYFQEVPIFYTPYINFPMDNRASGFLFPTIGTHQSISQKTPASYVSIPYYFNLAPNLDDTLTLTGMQDRGLVFGNEFRYLEPNHSATLTTHWLRDNVTSSEGIAYLDNTGQVKYTDPVNNRWDTQLTAQQHWADGLNSNILWREVSDENFYADIPVDSTLDTVTNTERHINLNYQKQAFSAHISMLDYLRLRKNAAYNYEKKPEVGMSYSHNFDQGALNHFGTNILAETTDFQTSSALAKLPEAKRSYLSPSVNYTLLKPYGQLKAEVIANKVHYNMVNNGYNTSGADEHDITLPQYALNGSLNFERSLSFGQHQLVQTLVPQIQYLYVPYQNQSNIPIFDTAVQSLDFSNLFSYNRFSGVDRIGDTNQVSAALTTQLLSEEGQPIAEAGIGQILYFDNRKVQLPGTAVDTAKVSDYFAKFGFMASAFTFASTSQYSKQNLELTNANNRLKLNLSPRFTLLMTNTIQNYNLPSKQENLATGFNWQMNPQWTLGSYWNYDFTAERKNEVSSAIRYDSCCWASELSVKEAQLANGLYNYGIQYLIELKGLSSVGTPFKKYLTDKLDF